MLSPVIIIAILLAAGIAGLLLFRYVRRRLKDIKVDQTKLTIESIRKIAQWTFVKEFIERYDIETRPRRFLGTKRIVLITKSVIRAGYDFTDFPPENISIDGTTLRIRLPEVKILDVISNPSDYDFYDQTGQWSEEDLRELKVMGRDRNVQQAIDEDRILEKADATGRLRIKKIFEAIGFKEVIFY